MMDLIAPKSFITWERPSHGTSRRGVLKISEFGLEYQVDIYIDRGKFLAFYLWNGEFLISEPQISEEMAVRWLENHLLNSVISLFNKAIDNLRQQVL